jgi:hypothetical protein
VSVAYSDGFGFGGIERALCFATHNLARGFQNSVLVFMVIHCRRCAEYLKALKFANEKIQFADGDWKFSIGIAYNGTPETCARQKTVTMLTRS